MLGELFITNNTYEFMLPISYKSTSYYYAYWIGQYAAFKGLSISGLQDAPMNCVSWVFSFPSEVMQMLFPQEQLWGVTPNYLCGDCGWSAEAKQRFLEGETFPYRQIISVRIAHDRSICNSCTGVQGPILIQAKLASWILFIVILAPPFEVSKAFFGFDFQRVCKLTWPELEVLMWPGSLPDASSRVGNHGFLWFVRLVCVVRY